MEKKAGMKESRQAGEYAGQKAGGIPGPGRSRGAAACWPASATGRGRWARPEGRKRGRRWTKWDSAPAEYSSLKRTTCKEMIVKKKFYFEKN